MTPGGKASTDHIVLTQPVLITQISRKLTNQCVNGSIVFVDHFSDHIYAYPMRDFTLDETLSTKHGYEHFLAMHGIISKGYHADNGHFADKGFCDDCFNNGQVILFCGVGSHHQNGIAECRVKDLTFGAWTLLLHAKRMLLEFILLFFGPLFSNVMRTR